jgi:hypothetical protein
MKLIPLLFSFVLLFAASSCKKTNISELDKLPAATDTGANIFGCLVNGQIYIPSGMGGASYSGEPNPYILYDESLYGVPYLVINARQYNSSHAQTADFVLNVDSLVGTGIYPLKYGTLWFGSDSYPSCGIANYDTTSFKTGEVVITKYDLADGIISGTFNFKYKVPTCNDTTYITEGRFDMKL